MMAVIRRRCQHNARQFDIRCNFLPSVAALDALCFVGLAIRLHMCWCARPDVVVREQAPDTPPIPRMNEVVVLG
jgi:hypothetical protein